MLNDRKYILTYFLTNPNDNILTDYIIQAYIFSFGWDSIYEIWLERNGINNAYFFGIKGAYYP